MKLFIPSPCSENWDKMQAHEKGKFCQSCQKNVVDFTKNTDREIYQYLQKHPKTCGKFKVTQLERKLNKQIDFQRYFPLGSVATLTLILTLPLMSCNSKPSVVEPQTSTVYDGDLTLGEIVMAPEPEKNDDQIIKEITLSTGLTNKTKKLVVEIMDIDQHVVATLAINKQGKFIFNYPFVLKTDMTLNLMSHGKRLKTYGVEELDIHNNIATIPKFFDIEEHELIIEEPFLMGDIMIVE